MSIFLAEKYNGEEFHCIVCTSLHSDRRNLISFMFHKEMDFGLSLQVESPMMLTPNYESDSHVALMDFRL